MLNLTSTAVNSSYTRLQTRGRRGSFAVLATKLEARNREHKLYKHRVRNFPFPSVYLKYFTFRKLYSLPSLGRRQGRHHTQWTLLKKVASTTSSSWLRPVIETRSFYRAMLSRILLFTYTQAVRVFVCVCVCVRVRVRERCI